MLTRPADSVSHEHERSQWTRIEHADVSHLHIRDLCMRETMNICAYQLGPVGHFCNKEIDRPDPCNRHRAISWYNQELISQ